MNPSNNSNNNNNAADDDDEFDDLFSFGVASAPAKHSSTTQTSSIQAPRPSSSSSGESSPSSSESYHKVSAPSSTTTTTDAAAAVHSATSAKTSTTNNDDDDDDIFGDFDLNLDTKATINSNHPTSSSTTATAAAMTKEEDFNGMDEGTREILDFLEQDNTVAESSANEDSIVGVGPTETTTTTATTTSTIDMDDILGTDSPKKALAKPSTAGDILAGLDDSDEEDEPLDEAGQSSSTTNHVKDDDDDDNVLVEEPIDSNIQINNDDSNMDMIGMKDNNDMEDIVGFVTVHSSNEESLTTTSTEHQEHNKNDDVSKGIHIISEKQSTTPKISSAFTPTTVKLPLHSQPKNAIRQTSLPTLPKRSVTNKNRQSSTSSTQSDSILASISDMENQHKVDSFLVDSKDGKNESKGIRESFSIDNEDDDGEDKTNAKENDEVETVTFESLKDALQSSESTIEHIRPFIYTNKRQNHIVSVTQPSSTSTAGAHVPSNYITSVTREDRPHLWSKVICSKVLSDVQTSSLVDAFIEWSEKEFDYEKFAAKENSFDLDMELVDRILNEVNILSLRIVSGLNDYDSKKEEENNFQLEENVNANSLMSDEEKAQLFKAKRDLCSLLVFYYRSTSNLSTKKVNSFARILKKTESTSEDNDNEDSANDIQTKVEGEKEEESTDKEDNEGENNDAGREGDEVKVSDEKVIKEKNESTTSADEVPFKIHSKPLLGPIAATLLSAGVPVEVASVMLSRIISTLPLFSLTELEQRAAVKSLHQQLYFLACYHLPLLVLHLDRYAPGWHWPRVDSDEDSDESKTDNLSVTERGRNLQAHGTIPVTWFASLLAGEGTSDTLEQAHLLPLWDILLTSDDQSLKFFLALATLEKHSDSLMMLRGQDLIDELSSVMSLKSMVKDGDESFLGSRQKEHKDISNDENFILNWYHDARQLQEATPISVTLDLRKAEDVAVNHILTMRSKIAMEQMTARLEAEAEAHRKAVEEEVAKKAEARLYEYYKKRLERFYDRHCPEKKATVDSILENYKDRYVLLDHKLQKKYGSGFLPLMAVFNPKISNQTNKFVSNFGQGIETRKKNIIAKRAKERAEKLDEDIMGPGAHQVAAKVSASEILPFICGGSKNIVNRGPIKFYLVDSRPNETIQDQGSFPTSVRLSPEDLMDPEKIQEKVDMFESLRGAIHICIMGEGFSSLPKLYDHPLTKVEAKLLDNDKARTNMCALFFIKKGFPFISVLDGGFAAAHAWIARDCEYLTLNKVLVDYDEKASLFAELERSYQTQKEYSNASTRRKTTLALQKLMDNSMTRLTMLENRIEEFTDRPRGRADSTQTKTIDADETADLSTSNNEKDEKEAFTNKGAKIAPIRFFGSRKDAGKVNIVEGDEKEKMHASPNENNDDLRNINVNTMKSGLNKAFSGLKKIRVPQKAAGLNSDEPSGSMQDTDSKKNVGPLSVDDKQPQQKQNQGFNFGRFNFGNKKNNVFRKGKESGNDDDIEKEIEASLTKPVDGDSKKAMLGLKTKAKPAENKPKVNRQFVNPLNKFGSINRKNKAAVSIIREEESLFFDDEESLGETEDSLSFLTNDTSINTD